MISRRRWLKGVSVGAGSVVFSPLLKSLGAQVEGTWERPKRFVFVLLENGLLESEVQPDGVPWLWKGGERRDLPLGPLSLPEKVIDPFTPFKDRMTILQGVRGGHLFPDHGAGFGALSGVFGGPAKTRVVAESIDAALARISPGIFPIVALGIDPPSQRDSLGTTIAYASSAWGRGSPIPIQCRPELAFESLFGGVGADRNDFFSRKNLLDFVAGDIRPLRRQLAGAEREQLDNHLGALESLSRRSAQLGAMKAEGKLAPRAPKLPASPPVLMPDLMTAQFDIAAAALTAGLTNVVTITSGLCTVQGCYKGFSNLGMHAAGHDEPDHDLGVKGWEIVRRAHRFMAERTADLVKKLKETPEGRGTMLDNTLVVFMSDSANGQHCDGFSWPFVLIGDLGGRLKTGRLVTYPMVVRTGGHWGGHDSKAPSVNALYCTLLHAVGTPRDHFNLTVANVDRPGPIAELMS